MLVVAGLMMFVGALVLIVAGTIVNGYVLSILWGWFAVPIFGLRPLSIPEALATALVVGFLTKQYVPSKDGDHDVWLYVLLHPAIALLVGWIVLKFM